MKIIETERWVPSKEDPSRSEYIGQRTGQEVFEELRQQLENMGCLPDEYFLLDQRWENGREIPEGADIFCTTDYGASEGIYLDVYLKWYEDGNPVTLARKGIDITGRASEVIRQYAQRGDAWELEQLLRHRRCGCLRRKNIFG